MIKSLLKLFEANNAETDTDPQKRIDIATAALLLEVVKADDDTLQQELDSYRAILASTLSMSGQQLDELIEEVNLEVKEASSLYQFTSLIDKAFSEGEKFELIKKMWQVAFSDGNLDKYEELIIRKSADLIHLSHARFIQAKLQVQES